MSACQNRKQQGSGTSSSETIASLSRVCNFSSNIINDTLKSIFVKTSEYAHLFAQEWCQLNGRVYRWREGKRMEKLFPDVLHSLSTALTANSNWGSAKFNMKKKYKSPHNVSTKYVLVILKLDFYICVFSQHSAIYLSDSFWISSNVKSGFEISSLLPLPILFSLLSFFLSNQFPFNVTVNTYLWWLFQ